MTGLTTPATDTRSGSAFGEARPEDLALPSGLARLRRLLAVLAVLAVVAATQALGASAQSVDDLRGDIPTGDDLRAEQAEVAELRAAALAERASAEGELFDVMFRRDELDDTQRRLAAEIEATTTNLRRVAVEAFIIGGEVGTLEYLAAVQDASDFSWRRHLVRSHAGSSRVAVDRLRTLREQADSEVLESIALAEALRIEITVLETELALLDDRDERAGAKFASMELIGLPWRVTIGPRGLKSGTVELTRRRDGETHEVSPEDAVARLAETYARVKSA